MADVVESIIGAAYLHGDLPFGYECVKYFDLGLQWKPTSTRIDQILAHVDLLTCGQASPTSIHCPPQLEDVERMLGYTFNRKVLLVEALTHASYQSDNNCIPSYERMEFLGDSILDLIVNEYLYHAPGKNYSPGHVYLRKIAVVNTHLLGYICLSTKVKKGAVVPMPNPVTGVIEETYEEHDINLFNCLLHTSPRVLEDQTNTYSRFKKMKTEIGRALAEGNTFPWTALTKLQAPKFFNDMIESLLGAVFLDSRGDMDIIRNIMKKIGIMRVLEHIVVDDVDVLHPISRLTFWTQKTGQELDFRFDRKGANIVCQILIGGTELEGARASTVFRGNRVSQDEVKFAAAEAAIEKLKLRAVTKKRKESRSTVESVTKTK